ncbi:hypothetical protein H4R33_000154 [Dimargaris cristalligena]|uniref:ethanolamine kinase n=1 Tax=Dimargaris cristalligena TaxID=215637 RepID=A0A4Q0A2U3_9FUNG|nr:hypothetical protein H4R33_000154 [Dimargaris cristalligena]RKP40466.1 choline/ethanolamine kinase [Dimargaris cristalligena]|eukprot:RKP40466.1 choline/ethanolamine kinase [Dimargaris cristalligena]
MTHIPTLELPSLTVLPLTVSHKHLLVDSQKAVLALFPAWKPTDLDLIQCKDGITNKLVRCTNRRNGTSVLIRAYGKNSEVLIDRNQELINIYILSQLGLCPPLYGKFNNGIVYGYVPGDIVKVPQMSDPHISELVAKRIAGWHKVEIPGPKTSTLFVTLRKWLEQVEAVYSEKEPSHRFHQLFSLDKLRSELDHLQDKLECLNAPVVFSHNDLLSANIIYNRAEDKVSFIDHEYASYNYRGFDIGNHFAEFAGFDCQYNLYPDQAFQLTWLGHYLKAANDGQAATDDEIYELYREVNKFYLASHFYWALWAMVQAGFSDIDFDYMNYAKLRFDEYYRRHDELLSL